MISRASTANFIRGVLVFAGAALLLTACQQEPTTPESARTLQIEGRVSQGDGSAAVDVYRITRDGQKKQLPAESAQTNRNGTFTTTVTATSDRPLLLETAAEENRMRAVLEVRNTNAATLDAGTIDRETSVESDIYMGLLAGGRSVSLERVRSEVSTQDAAALYGHRQAIRAIIASMMQWHDARLKIVATVSDSGSLVELEQEFEVASTDSAAILDSLVNRVVLDRATVDSFLWLRNQDHDFFRDNGHGDGMWHNDDGENDESRYFDEDDHHNRFSEWRGTDLWIEVETEDETAAEVELEHRFFTSDTARSALVMAIADSSALSRSRIAAAMRFDNEHDDYEHDDPGDDEEDEEDEDPEDREEQDGELKIEIESSMELTPEITSRLDSLESLLSNDSSEVKLELEVELDDDDTQVQISSEMKGEVSTEVSALWNALRESIIDLVSSAVLEEEIEVEIVFERDMS